MSSEREPWDRRPPWSMRLLMGVLVLGVLTLGLGYVFLELGLPRNNPWLVLYPRVPQSLTAIFASVAFHADEAHLMGNLVALWVLGIWAFSLGWLRTIAALFYGIAFAGAATWLFGQGGAAHLGASGAIFALAGFVFLRSLRTSPLAIIVVCVFLGVWDTGFFDTIRPTAFAAENGISWLGHLGGLLGGMYAELESTGEAVRILYRSDVIDEEECEALMNRLEGKKDQGKAIGARQASLKGKSRGTKPRSPQLDRLVERAMDDETDVELS